MGRNGIGLHKIEPFATHRLASRSLYDT
jgi:hypothetical protein